MDLNRIFMKNASPTKVGGQAIMEGLMMRGSRALAVAMREPCGNIYLSVKPLKAPGKWKKVPILRGVVSFVSSLATGCTILMESADILERLNAEQSGEQPEQPDKTEEWLKKHFGDGAAFNILMAISLLLSIAMTVGLFILAPTFLLGLLEKAGIDNIFLLNLIEGFIRIAIFIAYCALISKMPEIKRVFQYHGAEHKTIHCYENGLDLTPENAQQFYTLHPRCGTSFMMFVMVISLLVHSFFGWPDLKMRVLTRLISLPVIAGLSYELLQFTGRHDNKLVQLISLPGIYLQKLTTREPDLAQLEVAIAAINAVLPSQQDPSVPVEYWVGSITPDGQLIKDEAATAEYANKGNSK